MVSIRWARGVIDGPQPPAQTTGDATAQHAVLAQMTTGTAHAQNGDATCVGTLPPGAYVNVTVPA